MSAKPAPHGPRIEAIDQFRGISILAVLVFHYLVRWQPPMYARDVTELSLTYPHIFLLGGYGVEIFFVISGFVIYMTLERCKSALEFGARRIARLMPAFIVASTITFSVTTIFGPPEMKVTTLEYLAGLFIYPSWLGIKMVDGVYWSLLVEVTFYLYMALLYVFVRRNVWVGFLGLLILGQTFQAFGLDELARYMLVRYSPFFGVGFAASLWIIERRRVPALMILAASAAALILNLRFFAPNSYVVILGASAVMFGLTAKGWSLPIPGLRYIGTISYSLYLVHQNIGVIIISALKKNGQHDFVALGLATLMSFILAVMIFKFAELPGQKLALRTLLGSRSASPVAPSAGTTSVEQG